MAFKSQDLSVIAYANGFTLWHYTTPDLAPDVFGPGYFDEAHTMLCVGDMVLANMATGGSFVSDIIHVIGCDQKAERVTVASMTTPAPVAAE